MTEGVPWKHILRFAFPVVVGLLLQQLYNTVDTIIVRIDRKAFAGLRGDDRYILHIR